MPHDQDTGARFETVLAEFDTAAAQLEAADPFGSYCRVGTLRSLVAALREGLADCASQAPVETSPRQQKAMPSGPVTPSGRPPGAEELERMQRAVDVTQLPGPPLMQPDEAGQPPATAVNAAKALLDAIDILDRIRTGLRDEGAVPEGTRDRLEQARQLVERSRNGHDCWPGEQ